MPGYCLANPDKARIDAKYFCTYCKLLLRDAMQTSCGHFYCQSCLPNLIQDQGQAQIVMVCLVDKQQLLSNEVFADKFMRREVFSIVVLCTFMEDGCKWKGEVRHLEEHTSGCEYLKVPCVHPECDVMVKKALLPEHLEKECLFRLVECDLCHAQIVLNRMTVQYHDFRSVILSNLSDFQFINIAMDKKTCYLRYSVESTHEKFSVIECD